MKNKGQITQRHPKSQKVFDNSLNLLIKESKNQNPTIRILLIPTILTKMINDLCMLAKPGRNCQVSHIGGRLGIQECNCSHNCGDPATSTKADHMHTLQPSHSAPW